MFRQLGADMGEALRASLPDIHRQIEVYILLSLVFSGIGACLSSVKRMPEKLSMWMDALEETAFVEIIGRAAALIP